MSSGEGRRVALVIGNSAYNLVAPLPKSERDARMVALALRRIGFQTAILESNLGREKLNDALVLLRHKPLRPCVGSMWSAAGWTAR